MRTVYYGEYALDKGYEGIRFALVLENLSFMYEELRGGGRERFEWTGVYTEIDLKYHFEIQAARKKGWDYIYVLDYEPLNVEDYELTGKVLEKGKSVEIQLNKGLKRILKQKN